MSEPVASEFEVAFEDRIAESVEPMTAGPRVAEIRSGTPVEAEFPLQERPRRLAGEAHHDRARQSRSAEIQWQLRDHREIRLDASGAVFRLDHAEVSRARNDRDDLQVVTVSVIRGRVGGLLEGAEPFG